MQGINKVILVGNVMSMDYSSLLLFTTERFRNKAGDRVDKTQYHRIVFQGDLLPAIAQLYISVGDKVYIEGSLKGGDCESHIYLREILLLNNKKKENEKI